MIILIIVTILIGVIGVSLGFIFEYIVWNKGICKSNNIQWEYFGSDSQGGRGYRAGEFVCWISYPFIDNKRSKK